ncbi:MAG: oligosaccharide flippase family protein [Geminicoccaceae bacterium]
MSLAATLGSRFALLLGGRVALLVLALLTTAMLTRILEPTGFGHYRTAVAYLALVISLADLGLASLFVREISRPDADQPRLIASFLGLRLAVAEAGRWPAGTGLAFLLPLEPQDRLGIVGGSFGFLAYSLHLLLFGLFQQKLRQRGVVLAEVTGGLVLVGLIILFAWAGAARFWFVVAMGLSICRDPRSDPRRGAASRALRPADGAGALARSRPAGRPLAVTTAICVLYFRADTVLLAFFRPAAEVGLYGVPVKVLDSCMGISLLLVGLFSPLMAHSARVDEVTFRNHLGNGLLTLAVGTALVGVGLVALAPDRGAAGRHRVLRRQRLDPAGPGRCAGTARHGADPARGGHGARHPAAAATRLFRRPRRGARRLCRAHPALRWHRCRVGAAARGGRRPCC